MTDHTGASKLAYPSMLITRISYAVFCWRRKTNSPFRFVTVPIDFPRMLTEAKGSGSRVARSLATPAMVMVWANPAEEMKSNPATRKNLIGVMAKSKILHCGGALQRDV